MKKQNILSILVVLFLLDNCSSNQTKVDNETKKEINKAVNICVALFHDDLGLEIKSIAKGSPYFQPFTYGSRNLTPSIRQEILNIKQKHTEDWVKFSFGEESWDKLKSVGMEYPKGNIWVINKTSNAKIAYTDVLAYCDTKMVETLKEMELQAQINERNFKLEQERQEKIRKELKVLIQKKGFLRTVAGLKSAVNEAYSSDKKTDLKTSLIIFNSGNYSENGLTVVSLQDNYAIYSNRVFTVAIKQRPNKSYLKDSVINGTYYKFVGTKKFNNKDFGKDELVLFEEVVGLEKYDQNLVKQIFN